MTVTTTAVPPAPRTAPARRLAVGLPNFLKFIAFAVGFIGVLAGLSMLHGIGLGSPLPGICVLIGGFWSAVSIYALGDIVLSLRKVAFNTQA